MTVHRSTLSIIGDRYLDTQLDREQIAENERELISRGVVGLKRGLLEYLAAGSLWWNVIWWEWCDLDGRDIRIGWLYNLFIGGFVVAAIGFCFGWQFALVAAILLHCITLYLGFSLRAGTVGPEQEA